MRRSLFILGLVAGVYPLGWAEITPVAGSSVPPAGIPVVSSGPAAMPSISTGPVILPVWVATPTIIDAGETISTPTPHAMTEPEGDTWFVTLTRTLMPHHALPTHAHSVFPERTRIYDAQNAAE